MKKWKRRNRDYFKYIKTAVLGLLILMVIVCCQNLKESGELPAMQEIFRQIQADVYVNALKTHMPAVTAATEERDSPKFFGEYITERMMDMVPLQGYVMAIPEYDTQVESELTYEMLMAREGVDEAYRDGEPVEEETTVQTQTQEEQQPPVSNSIQAQEPGTFTPVMEPVVHIDREKLNDFDYLIQNFYVVDKTTTINGTQLNAQELLAKDLRLTTPASEPQILIHHTHSQERYVDSTEDPATSIVGVGAYLTKLLQEQYGFSVIHDTGEYDVIDHDNAYAYAAPAIEQILAEHPSIEVVIDMHRDGIDEGHLVTEINGKQTAKIMFFNGLSRLTSRGDLEYLHNPYIQDNLAFSLQMKVLGEEYYPGFTRPNYLKGYRFNLHYCPKSMLVEVGAQTNTVQEAMNAMEPLADMLYKVLSP